MAARAVAVLLGLLATVLVAIAAHAQSAGDFRRFLDALWPDAEKAGISRATFDKALRGVEPDLALPDLVLPGKTEVKGQAEFTRTPAEYLNATFLAQSRRPGQDPADRAHASGSRRSSSELGVQRQFVLAIWGRETAFGAHRSAHYVIKALATQAYPRPPQGDVPLRAPAMRSRCSRTASARARTSPSSWAGAMGLTQFMPSEYYTMAYDLDGDGRKDIWGSVADALGSAAKQLREKGWVPGRAGATRCACRRAPPACSRASTTQRPCASGSKLGVVRATGALSQPRRSMRQAFILTPAGAHGPAFLALENFLVIKRYNMSDLYALFVGNLGDRIAGGGNFATPWAGIRQMSAKGIEEIQEQSAEAAATASPRSTARPA